MTAAATRRALVILALTAPGLGGQGVLTKADSQLVGRILLAEDRRDSTDAALADGAGHGDPRIRLLVQRARGRIRDPRFAARDSLPPLPPPTAWPDAGWRTRYRAVAAQANDCAAVRAALSDMMWPIRLRQADTIGVACASDSEIGRTLRLWVDQLPADASKRKQGEVSWHAAAHAIVALAKLRPEEARDRLPKLASHRQWQVRMYAARAARVLNDTARLRALAADRDDNVKEAAIEGLRRLGGHAFDDVYLAALKAPTAPAVRAAAIALKGSPRADVVAAANAGFEKWVKRANASERDVRLALLDAAGRPASEDRPPPLHHDLPPQAVALALGADVRLRVTMAEGSGGGSFVVKLRGDVAPMMAARVLELVKSGYYNNTGWHRVEHDFVVQGGGPGANEYVGNARYFRDELGTVPHARGTIGMSTRSHDTGDAQWFINLKDNLRLGRDYTVFAEVVEGIGVVDQILEGDVMASLLVLPPTSSQ
jgi:cyclophilin family peptidyl-prolyl cis-trans isomerase